MRDIVKEYRKAPDGFLLFADFVQFHPAISKAAKVEVLNAFVQDIVEPSKAK